MVRFGKKSNDTKMLDIQMILIRVWVDSWLNRQTKLIKQNRHSFVNYLAQFNGLLEVVDITIFIKIMETHSNLILRICIFI